MRRRETLIGHGPTPIGGRARAILGVGWVESRGVGPRPIERPMPAQLRKGGAARHRFDVANAAFVVGPFGLCSDFVSD